MITNLTTGETIARHVVRCDTFWKRGRGLMFRSSRAVARDRVYLFVERRVVDKALARPFRPYYAPRQPARYYVEGHPSLLERVRPGDQLGFD